MLQVPATFQINRVEQYTEFYKESLKMCSEHNEAKLICCFLPGNKYCTRKQEEDGPETYSCTLKMGQSLDSSCPQALFCIKKRRKFRSCI